MVPSILKYQVIFLFILITTLKTGKGFLFSREVCYKDLGCYTTKPPWRSIQRPIVLLPKLPQQIGTKFFLHTRSNPTTDGEQVIVAGQSHTLAGTYFNASLPTKFVVHGFTHDAHKQWVLDIVTQLLLNDDMNVITVDWKGGSGLPYTQAAANTRVVGAEIARLIKFLNIETQVFPKVHIIGHSLGAHIAGYVGERLDELGLPMIERITALDAAEPFFEHTDPIVRLDPTDAKFVDVVHSDGDSITNLALGLDQAIGHVDVYPNGGEKQPGCDTGIISKGSKGIWSLTKLNLLGAELAISCAHVRSILFFTESINSKCPMIAYPCSDWESFQQGKCLSCAENRCQVMGYYANKFTAKGKFYLTTAASSPFCSYHYLVAIKVSDDQPKPNWGGLKVALTGVNGTMSLFNFTKPDLEIKPGETLVKLVATPKDLGPLTAVDVAFKKVDSLLWGWKYQDNIKIERIIAYKGLDATTTIFCTKGVQVYNTGKKMFPVTPGENC